MSVTGRKVVLTLEAAIVQAQVSVTVPAPGKEGC